MDEGSESINGIMDELVDENIELVTDSFSALGPGLDAVTSIWILQKNKSYGERTV